MDHNDEMVREHSRNFENIFGRLGKLETDMAQVMPWKDRVDMDLYNHGQDGMKTILTKFIAAQEATTIERMNEERRRAQEMAKRDRHIGFWLKVISIVIAVLGVIVAWLALMQTIHNIHDGLLAVPKMSRSTASPALSAARRGQTSISPIVAFYEENSR